MHFNYNGNEEKEFFISDGDFSFVSSTSQLRVKIEIYRNENIFRAVIAETRKARDKI